MALLRHNPSRREVQTVPVGQSDFQRLALREALLRPFGNPLAKLGKRSMDVVFSALMLMFFGPVLITICICLYLKGQRTLFFQHVRIGKDGREFGCLKFQTMVPDANERLKELLESNQDMRREWSETRKLKNDPRIIPGIGEFLRSTSLDELPQLINILRGDMSLVGPRPVTEAELELYYGVYKRHYLSVKPGLTGPWQLGGRSDISYKERVRKDIWYVENATLRRDLIIFFKTVQLFLTARLKGSC